MEIEIKKYHKDVDCLDDAFAQFLEEEFYDTFMSAKCDWIMAFLRHSEKCYNKSVRVDTFLYERCNETMMGRIPLYVEILPCSTGNFYDKACREFFQKYQGEVYFYEPDLEGLDAENILHTVIDYEVYDDWSIEHENKLWKMTIQEASKYSKKVVEWETIVHEYEYNEKAIMAMGDENPSLDC